MCFLIESYAPKSCEQGWRVYGLDAAEGDSVNLRRES